jgi:hypothetical protein
MEYDFGVYSRRWGHNDNYSIEKTDTGWKVKHLRTNADDGNCDKQGNPYLFNELNQDSINYPADLGEYMEYLWDEATNKNMNDDEIQEHLNVISEWIQIVEKSSPSSEFWTSFK